MGRKIIERWDTHALVCRRDFKVTGEKKPHTDKVYEVCTSCGQRLALLSSDSDKEESE